MANRSPSIDLTAHDAIWRRVNNSNYRYPLNDAN